MNSTGSQTFNKQHISTGMTEGTGLAPPIDSADYEAKTKDLELYCQQKLAHVKQKFNEYTELVQNQIELKRLIKRNMKRENGVRKAVGRKRGPKPKDPQKLVCRMPFLVVHYQPDNTTHIDY